MRLLTLLHSNCPTKTSGHMCISHACGYTSSSGYMHTLHKQTQLSFTCICRLRTDSDIEITFIHKNGWTRRTDVELSNVICMKLCVSSSCDAVTGFWESLVIYDKSTFSSSWDLLSVCMVTLVHTICSK